MSGFQTLVIVGTIAALILLWVIFGRARRALLIEPIDSRRTYFPGPVFKAAYEKDPVLYDRLAPTMGMPQFWREWVKIYPEDFHDGGETLVGDAGAIRPKP